MLSDCPCGFQKSYSDCCEPFHRGIGSAPTAEALMRSRYAAYVLRQIPYLIQTVHPSKRMLHNPVEILSFANSVEWVKLDIVRKSKGMEADDTGTVEFKAWYKEKGRSKCIHERSQFEKSDGLWMYVEGKYY